jgi:hypothetical protein
MHRYGRAAVLVHTTATAQHAIRSQVNIAATLAGQDDDINTIDAIHNLGNLYTEQGKLDETKEVYVLALKGYEKLFYYNHQCCHRIGCALCILRDHGGTEEIDREPMPLSRSALRNVSRNVLAIQGSLRFLLLDLPNYWSLSCFMWSSYCSYLCSMHNSI